MDSNGKCKEGRRKAGEREGWGEGGREEKTQDSGSKAGFKGSQTSGEYQLRYLLAMGSK